MGEIPVLEGPSRHSSARQVVWTQGLETSGSVYHDFGYDYDYGYDFIHDEEEVYNKICSVFAGVNLFPFKTMIFQFWQPVSDLVLASFPKVYAAPPFIRSLRDKYRACSLKYYYCTNEGDNHPDWIISGGPVAAAFRNRFPEVVLDLRLLSGSPLVDVALECELICCVMLPVFRADECLGVVECSMKHPSHLLPIFNEMERELKKVDLSIYHVQGKWPYKTISPGGLEHVQIEIKNALGMACESHGLTLAQVWISYESENDLMSLVKLSWYSLDSDEDPMSSIKDFYDKFDVISLKKGDGLVLKTLQNHKSHLCRNIYKLPDNRGVLALLSSANTKCASFVICLRSSHTGELDYAFEFFWPHCCNHLFMLESLLSTLKKNLPSFKFASGGQLDDEVFVVDVSDNESRLVKIPQGNEDAYGGGCDDDDVDDDVDDDLAILATYRNKILLFDLPHTSTIEDLMIKLKEEFELDPTWTYKVEHEDFPNQWSSMVNLESYRKKEDMGLIKLRVRDEGREVGWRWRTNS